MVGSAFDGYVALTSFDAGGDTSFTRFLTVSDAAPDAFVDLHQVAAGPDSALAVVARFRTRNNRDGYYRLIDRPTTVFEDGPYEEPSKVAFFPDGDSFVYQRDGSYSYLEGPTGAPRRGNFLSDIDQRQLGSVAFVTHDSVVLSWSSAGDRPQPATVSGYRLSTGVRTPIHRAAAGTVAGQSFYPRGQPGLLLDGRGAFVQAIEFAEARLSAIVVSRPGTSATQSAFAKTGGILSARSPFGARLTFTYVPAAGVPLPQNLPRAALYTADGRAVPLGPVRRRGTDAYELPVPAGLAAGVYVLRVEGGSVVVVR